MVFLAFKLRQGTFSRFVISDRNLVHQAVISIAYTGLLQRRLSPGQRRLRPGFGSMPWTTFAVFFHVTFACLFWLMAGRIWRMAKEYNAQTVPQLPEPRHNSLAGKIILAAIMLRLNRLPGSHPQGIRRPLSGAHRRDLHPGTLDRSSWLYTTLSAAFRP
jgi:sodium/pantothenate symporter